MAEPGQADPDDPSLLLWRATPRPRRIVLEFLGSLVIAVGYALLILRFTHDPMPEVLLAMAPPVVEVIRSIIVSFRGRVVLRPDSLEVRRVLTRRYPWSSLKSITLDEGRIEVTPDGWVRKLPIPPSRARAALAEIEDWRTRLPGAPGRPSEG